MALLGWPVASGTVLPTAAASRFNPPLAIPPSGAFFGAFADAAGDGESPVSFSALESASGRALDMDRVYSLWNTPQPSPQAAWDVGHAVIPVVSIDTQTTTGGTVSWAAIAAGQYDTTIAAQARGLASLPGPVVLSFDHEPDMQTHGTAANFVAAYRHYVSVVRATGASNVSFALILTAPTYATSAISSWYPGDGYVDWVAADGYNGDGCLGHGTKWLDFSVIFAGLDDFAVARAKPALIAEWASSEDPAAPGRKAQWITDAATTLRGWPRIKAALYFDAPGHHPSCGWPLTTSRTATQAFKAMGAEAWFHPRPVASLTTPTTSGPAPLSVTFSSGASKGFLRPISSWQLEFGDGTTSAGGSGTPAARVSHRYGPGTFTAVLTVVDTAGQYGQASVNVVAYPRPHSP
jgi:hypothetical protein